MTNSERNFVKIISEICNENKIPLNSYGKDWVFELEKNKKFFYIIGYEFPDVSSSKKICDDKSSLSEILTKHNITNVQHTYFMNPKDIFYIGELDWKKRLQNTFISFNNNVVVKPNSGTSGINVYHITKFNELLKTINKIFTKGLHAAVCPYYDIQNEYRSIIYKNKLQILFDKKRKSSWKHNLANGSVPINVTNKKLKKQISDLAIKATTLLNIKFASVDIVKINNELKILEINSGVMLEKFSSISQNNYKQVKQLYKKVILDL